MADSGLTCIKRRGTWLCATKHPATSLLSWMIHPQPEGGKLRMRAIRQRTESDPAFMYG